jgi:hypothetical protein
MPSTVKLSFDGNLRGIVALSSDSIPTIKHASVAGEGFGTQIRTRTGAEVSPVHLAVNPIGAEPLLQWIRNTVARSFTRHHLTLLTFDPLKKAAFEVQMSDCLLTQAIFPEVSRLAKASTAIIVEIRAERVKIRKLGDSPPHVPHFTPWAPGFRVEIEGFSNADNAVTKLGALALTQGFKMHWQGAAHFGDMVATKVDFGKLVLTLGIHSRR